MPKGYHTNYKITDITQVKLLLSLVAKISDICECKRQ